MKNLASNLYPIIIRFKSQNGDVDVVMNEVKNFIRTDFRWYLGPYFMITRAEICMDLANFSGDPKKDDFYPLRIYGLSRAGETVLMCSEFRTGYHGDSVDKLIRTLQDIGFTLDAKTIETIYNDAKLNITLFK